MSNVLERTRFYLIGAIEADKSYGISWRQEVKEKLKDLNLVFLDPCDKPFIKDLKETEEKQDHMKFLRSAGNKESLDELSSLMKEIRNHDLSCVDRSDAIIYYYDSDIMTCGSWEEFFLAVSIKRTIFFISKNGINTIPLWVFGCLPHKYFYSGIDECVKTLKGINSGEINADSERWRLFRREYR